MPATYCTDNHGNAPETPITWTPHLQERAKRAICSPNGGTDWPRQQTP